MPRDRRAYGFHSARAALALIFLTCGSSSPAAQSHSPFPTNGAILVRESLLPLLSLRVRQELTRVPDIFVDDQLKSGVSWPSQLGLKLGGLGGKSETPPELHGCEWS